MATNASLKQSIESKPANPLTNVVKQQLNAQFKAIKNIVPRGVTPERLCRVALNALTRNEKLQQCSVETIVGAIIASASLGLEPNLIGHAYIVPFYNGKTKQMEAQLQVGYKGLIELARRSGQVQTIAAHEVYEGDKFEYSYGFDEKLVHIPCGEDDPEKITHFYAYYTLHGGGRGFAVMTKDQVNRHRDKFTKSRDKSGNVFGPWFDHYVSMALKTVLIKALKYAPMSIEPMESTAIEKAVAFDGSTITVSQNTPETEAVVIDDVVTVDKSTGEVVGGPDE